MPSFIDRLLKRSRPGGPAPGLPASAAGSLVEEGRAAEDAGDLDAALDAYRRALEVDPGHAEARLGLGMALQGKGDFENAAEAYTRLLEIEPGHAAAHFNRGLARLGQGHPVQAESDFRSALRLRPGFPEALVGLAEALDALGRDDDALQALEQAIGQRSDYEAALMIAGGLLQRKGRAADAEAMYRRVLAFAPASTDAHAGLADCLAKLGRPDEAAEHLHKVRVAESELHDVVLISLNLASGFSRAQVFAEHREWGRRCAELFPAPTGGHANVPVPGRRLRIGYVSPDFRRHSVAYFIEPVLAGHDRRNFEVFCYSNVAIPDGMTARLLGMADHARDIAGLNDTDAARRIRADGIDILVDLAGHMSRHRLAVFALKPAPVQATYLGYPNTTGLPAIDWRITDAHADPDGDEFHVEKLVRLPQSFLCFRPSPESPAVAPAPCLEAGHITFGSFNALAKITPEVMRVWARLLEKVPASRLLLKAYGLDANARARVLGQFGELGIPATRVTVLLSDDDLRTHLGRYARMDIALDPFPFNGTTTTLEALWMGVPVVAIAGDRHSARVGASILANAGLQEWVAAGTEQYIELAAGLAGDFKRVAELRRSMRERIAASPLRDEPRFVAALEGAYRQMWESWCAARAAGQS